MVNRVVITLSMLKYHMLKLGSCISAVRGTGIILGYNLVWAEVPTSIVNSCSDAWETTTLFAEMEQRCLMVHLILYDLSTAMYSDDKPRRTWTYWVYAPLRA